MKTLKNIFEDVCFSWRFSKAMARRTSGLSLALATWGGAVFRSFGIFYLVVQYDFSGFIHIFEGFVECFFSGF